MSYLRGKDGQQQNIEGDEESTGIRERNKELQTITACKFWRE